MIDLPPAARYGQRFRSLLSLRLTRAIVLLLTLHAAGVAHAQRLDDSASPRARIPASVDTASIQAGSPYVSAMFRGVEYRLATAPYAGKRARIYLVVPSLVPGLRSPAGLRVEWSGSDALAPGSAMAGEQRLVWTGVVPGPWITERLDLRLQLDLREWRPASTRGLDLETYFFIEVLP
ncbi:hypothetical protein [Pseudacidovorax intermedius]|uniref:hypothetical protein n=1 Tax=Pseudacidovorax intermedius TaxID=433924 RepID=UPI00069D59C7|nr:hypothetical protein [Pseudacidovorax intermedius]